MFISSNTPPPAKRCRRALMKLFGLAAPVAKELRLSCFFFFHFFLLLPLACRLVSSSRDQETSDLEVLQAQGGGVSSTGSGKPRLETRPCCDSGMGRKSASCQITRLLLYLQQGVGAPPRDYHQPTSSHLALWLIS